MIKLTDKQRQIYDYIKLYISKFGFPPSVREICQAVGLKSTSAVHYHLNALEELGLITRSEGKTRAISLPAEEEKPLGVPLLGYVAAGQPILAVENAIDFIRYDVGENGEFFALQIRGDSMINAGILNGDTIIVRKQSTARNGDIVVALLGDEATCKRLSLKNGEVWLMPENDDYEPIYGPDSTILGRVMAVIRTY